MANAWAFSALSAGSASIAKWLAMEFKASAFLPETTFGVAARPILGALDCIGGSHGAKRQDHFPGIRDQKLLDASAEQCLRSKK